MSSASPRVKSEIFVSSLTRSVFAQGGFAAIVNSGNAEAGAIFIQWRKANGSFVLLGPAPSYATFQDDANSQAEPQPIRQFEILPETDEISIGQRMIRERSYDMDLWLVELEAENLPSSVFIAENSI